MSVVQDGKGRGNEAAVNVEQRLLIDGPLDSMAYHANQQYGEAYVSQFTVTPVGAGDLFLLVENLDDEDLVITDITLIRAAGAEDHTVTLGQVGTAAYTATAGGTIANKNAGSNKSPNAIFRDDTDITGLTGGRIVEVRSCGATPVLMSWVSGLILPKGGRLTLTAGAAGASPVQALINFYFGSAKV